MIATTIRHPHSGLVIRWGDESPTVVPDEMLLRDLAHKLDLYFLFTVVSYEALSKKFLFDTLLD